MDLHAWITQQVDETEAAAHIVLHQPTAVLRRCEADRRVLTRHATDPTKADDWLYATVCQGCGWTGDCDDPVTDNVNDCPELLDLAHAHGLTDEILAGLDRPQPPERKPHVPSYPYRRLTAADVPPALRGPHLEAP